MRADALRGRTILMSGGSRGIGLAIAVAAGRLGANVVMLAKTGVADPRLPGTVHSAAAEVAKVGGTALAVVGDVRSEDDVNRAVQETVERFGGIDICINNASAYNTSATEDLPFKRFSLMQQIQVSGTFLLTQAALPYLRRSDNAHILSLSPPLNMSRTWLGTCPGYMVAKYGMTLLTLGIAEEYRSTGIAANTLWPESYIATVAVERMLDRESLARSRSPEIVADAAMQIITSPASITGNSFIDVDVLADAGHTDLRPYGEPVDLLYDLFIDPPSEPRTGSAVL